MICYFLNIEGENENEIDYETKESQTREKRRENNELD